MTDQPTLPPIAWRVVNTITDWEFGQVGGLLCDHTPRDLALMVVRLQGQLETMKEMRRHD